MLRTPPNNCRVHSSGRCGCDGLKFRGKPPQHRYTDTCGGGGGGGIQDTARFYILPLSDLTHSHSLSYTHLHVYQFCNISVWSCPLFPWIQTQRVQHLLAFAFLKGSINSSFNIFFFMCTVVAI